VHDVADSARQLDAAPEELRGWEWRHLESRLDDSSTVIPTPARNAGLFGAPYRLQAWVVTNAGLQLTDLENHGEPTNKPMNLSGSSLTYVVKTRRGLRIATWVRNTSFELLDETGGVLCTVELPAASQPGPVGVSPDGTRLTCQLPGSILGVFDAHTGKQTAGC